MKRTVLSVLLVLLMPGVLAQARDADHRTVPFTRWTAPGEVPDDEPLRVGGEAARAETTWFGGYTVTPEGEYHAESSPDKDAVMWTFDRGTGPYDDPDRLYGGEGWRAVDLTRNVVTYFRRIDASLDLGPGVPPPIIHGEGSLWVGADKSQADAMCWPCGPGYGNVWCQRAVSEPLAYDGSGPVVLSFSYFNNSEPCYDGTQVYLQRADASELLLNAGEVSCPDNPYWEGGFTDSIGSYADPAVYTRSISDGEIGGPQTIRIIIEFKSDGGWSGEDCEYTTTRGPFGADDVSVTGGGIDVVYDFESGLDPWSADVCEGIGSFAGIVDFGCYDFIDPCDCRLSGNILKIHAGGCPDGFHPLGQHEILESPICDIASGEPHDIFMDLDTYADMNFYDGVMFRVQWSYYPWTCPVNGHVGWSPADDFRGVYQCIPGPVCISLRYSATAGGNQGGPIPPTSEKVKAIIELQADCSAFTIYPCSGESEVSPLLDNIVIGTAPAIHAPPIATDVGRKFVDGGSYPSSSFDPRAPGPANVVFDRYLGDPARPTVCGDSLVVVGPNPGTDPNTRWEARMWWRVARRAPFQADVENGVTSRYKIWRDRVGDGHPIDRPYKPEFTFGWMDSAQTGFSVHRNKFTSNFREDDDDFVGEGNPESEMLWDDIFYPGTRIEYFITSSYVNDPGGLFYLPDTSGGNFFEFEILPGMRVAEVAGCGGSPGFNFCAYVPATLYVDAFNVGAQVYIENGLRTILNGYPICQEIRGCPIPPDRNWDRYDYADAASSWHAPFARGQRPGSNNGMTLAQILGYRTILLNTGTYSTGSMDDADFGLFREWLTTEQCFANASRQAFLVNGDNAGQILDYFNEHGRPFLQEVLGAALYCDAFNGTTTDPDCGPVDESYCVRWLPSDHAVFGQTTDVDVYGSGCPNLFEYNVFSENGTGQGNRIYLSEPGGKEMAYGQVANWEPGAANYRTVLDGASWHHMTLRDASGEGTDRCPSDLPSIVGGIVEELGIALRWAFEVPSNDALPKLANVETLSQCEGTWNLAAGAEEGPLAAVNRLWQNDPNPFNPRTTLKFSLASADRVTILIYDIGGRLVRTLVDARRDAGPHAVVWDGTNDRGSRVGSGIYWAQMKTGSFLSNKKMVVLK